MRVRFTDTAREDLRAIGRYIATDNPSRAGSFVSELLERCLGLAEHGSRHPIAIARQGREFRSVRHGSYLIFYSIVDEGIEVDHIVHQSRDYMRLLFPDD